MKFKVRVQISNKPMYKLAIINVPLGLPNYLVNLAGQLYAKLNQIIAYKLSAHLL